MKNITTFLSKSTIKPELAHVFVNEKDGAKYAVATDSFRLAELTITDDFLKDNLTTGYYTAKQWIELCKAYNKKKRDITAFMHTMLQVNAMQPIIYKDWQYPDYKQIIDRFESTGEGINQKFNPEYLIDFITLMPQIPYGINTNEIKHNAQMIVYKNESITLLLMAINR